MSTKYTSGEHDVGRRFEKKFRQTWTNIIQRCKNPNNPRFGYYNKVGVCDRWLNFYFFKNDMLDEYTEHVAAHGIDDTTIDRVDNYKGYSRENCRWATREVNGQNRDMKYKKKHPSEKQSCGFYVRFTPSEAKYVRSLAKNWKCSIGGVIRLIVTEENV